MEDMKTIRRKGYSREGFWAERNGKKYYVSPVKIKPTRFKIHQRGSGKGEQILPPVERPGAMTIIAQEMGYGRPTDIPYGEIPEYAQLLVSAYGKKSALGMIRRQLVYRKNMTRIRDGTSVEKFQRMFDIISSM